VCDHGDFAQMTTYNPKNWDDGICWIADIGLSRQFEPSQVNAATSNIPVRYDAPEVLSHKRTP
jgi:hypothetical protein